MKLAIAAIFKNEKPYILEWLAFHRLMGVDQFFIADNISDDGSTELLLKLHDAGLITRIPFPTVDGKGPQLPAYNKILGNYCEDLDLLAFIDADEFIVPSEGMSIRPYLVPLLKDESVGAIALNWAIYGSSGHIEYEDHPVIERFTHRARQQTGTNRHIKSLLKPAYCERMLNPHKVQLKRGKYVKANGSTFSFYEKNRHGSSDSVDWEPLRVNHYVIKSFDEFKNRKQRRGRATVNELRRDGFFKAHDMNHEPCKDMDRFYEPVKREMQNIQYQLALAEYSNSNKKKPGFLSKACRKTGVIGRWVDRKLEYTLLPCSDIKPSESTRFNWQAVGSDPGFMAKRHGALPKGWYMLTVKVKSDKARLNGKLYVNYGSGMSEETAINLPLKNGALMKKVCFFPEAARSIRFDPADEACCFNIEVLEFSKLTKNYARKLILKKIKSVRMSTLPSNLSHIDLLKSYEELFIFSRRLENYSEWVQLNEVFRKNSEFIVEKQNSLKKKIKFDLALIFHESDEPSSSVIDAVVNQSYKDFRLSIVHNNQTEKLSKLYNKLTDEEINYFPHIVRNGNLSACLNNLISDSDSDYLTILDSRDTISKHSLLFLADKIQREPDIQILYTDEDLIDKDGKRSKPHFKSDWNPDLFYSDDYISDFVTFKIEQLKAIGGFRTNLESLYIYDAILRASDSLDSSQIARIPEILVHKKKNKESHLSHADLIKSGQKSRSDFFAQKKENIKISYQNEKANYRIQWPIPENKPLVSLLVPTRDGYDILKQCIDSILSKTSYQNYEIIVLDNQSECLKTLSYFHEISLNDKVRVLAYDYPFNYSAINNFGVKHAKGSIIGLINNDIEVISGDWLTEMVSHAIRPEIGCVGAKLYYANDTLQHGGVICGLGGVAGHSHKHFKRTDSGYFNRLNCVQTLSAVTAAVLLLRKDIFLEVEGLDENNLVVALNDVDLCLKVREAGYRNLWTPYAELYHHESISRGLDDTPEKKARFEKEFAFMQKKWKGKIESDPFYNPNLTHTKEDFSLRI